MSEPSNEKEGAVEDPQLKIQEIMECLNCLSAADISELKRLSNPHKDIQMVMTAVAVLFNAKEDWTSVRAMFKDPKFMEKLLCFDKDDISPKVIKKLKDKYLSNPNFTVANIKLSSVSAASLWQYVSGMVRYYDLARSLASLATHCKNGDMERVTAMLATATNIDEPDDDLNTPLMLALMQNHTNIVKLLLSKGAKPNLANKVS